MTSLSRGLWNPPITTPIAVGIAKFDFPLLKPNLAAHEDTRYSRDELLLAKKRTPLEALKLGSSGVYVYDSASDSIVPIERRVGTLTGRVKTTTFLNDLFARAYFGGLVWEGELTAKPQDGTGFLKYITPTGRVVFFPLCWTFSGYPEAFLLVLAHDEAELGVEFSYYNVYTSLAEMANTAKCDAYFRVYEDGKGDVAQLAQLVTCTDPNLTLQPEYLDDQSPKIEFDVSISTLSTISAEPNANRLENRTPKYVEVLELASGQLIARDAEKWATDKIRADPRARRGRLPPVFVN